MAVLMALHFQQLSQAGCKKDLVSNPLYIFIATISDDITRFAFHSGSPGVDGNKFSSNVRVYVNSGNLYIYLHGNSSAMVRVYNLTGRLVLQDNIRGKSVSVINAVALPNGIYVVSVIKQRTSCQPQSGREKLMYCRKRGTSFLRKKQKL